MEKRLVAITLLGMAVTGVGTFFVMNYYGAPEESWLLKGGMVLSSTAFANGTKIPSEFTCQGEDISPPLSWSGYPPSARSLAIVMEDPDAPSGVFTHWILFNVPPSLGSLGSNQPADKNIHGVGYQGKNDFGQIGYKGPCPPPGNVHHYKITVFALSTAVNISPGSSRADLMREMMGHVLASGTLTGTFGSQSG